MPDTWPRLDPAALHGVCGDIINQFEAHTEADSVALLVHILAEFSCMIGRQPFVRLDGEPNPLLFWPVVCGDTSKSRKGSASRRIGRLFKAAFPSWTRGAYRGTLSSGEGLAFAVRDPEIKIDKSGQPITIDEGVTDKRLYLVQQEFSTVLSVLNREGSTLSGCLRDAWDGCDLKPMTKNNHVTATQPHVVVTGHITIEELQRRLAETEAYNGFANRFCWFAVRRSKFLPFASDPPKNELDKLIERLREVLPPIQHVKEIGLTRKAKHAWTTVYPVLSAGRPGMAGSLIGRAESQVRRIACLYAMLDQCNTVDIEHLQSALALWQHSEQSVGLMFGDRTGDAIADTILAALQETQQGLSDTDLSCLFTRHVSAARLHQAKANLGASGKIDRRLVTTNGRAKNVWFAVAK